MNFQLTPPLDTLAKTPEWLAEHHATIGGSAAAAVLGVSRFTTREMLRDKMLNPPTESLPLEGDLLAGTLLEPLSFVLLQRDGIRAEAHDQDEFIYHDDMTWAHSLPDGWIWGDDDIISNLEIKWPRPGTFDDCLIEGILEEWIVQCQHTMMVTGAGHMFIFVGHRVNFDYIFQKVERDNEFIGQLAAAEEEFFQNLTNDEYWANAAIPQIDVPMIPGKMRIVDNDEELIEQIELYQELRASASEVDDATNIVKYELLRLLGGHEQTEIRREGFRIARCYYRQGKNQKQPSLKVY